MMNLKNTLLILFVLHSLLMVRSSNAQIFDQDIVGRAIVRVPDAPGGGHDIENFATAFLMQEGITLSVADDLILTVGTACEDGDQVLAYLMTFNAVHQVAVMQALDPESVDQSSYEADGTIISGEVLYTGSAPEGKTGSTWVTSIGGFDAYTGQYATDMLNLDQAQGLSSGFGATVAVLDTGIDATHPQLAPNILPGGISFIEGADPNMDGPIPADTDGDGLFSEMQGHGTFVTGLITLVAPDARILPVTVLDSDGQGDAWGVAQGVAFAIDQRVDVINLSLGSTYDSDLIEALVGIANCNGIVVSAAGGNQNAGEDVEEFPAAKSDGFGVAAVDAQDIKADFSNFNDKFFISAPGASVADPRFADGFDPEQTVYSTLPGGGYGIWEGTSFATAFVSGAAAVIRPQITGLSGSALHSTIENRLALSAVNIYDVNPQFKDDEELGVGRLNVGGAALFGQPAPQVGDLDGDGSVGAADLAILLGQWGPCEFLGECPADLNADSVVNAADLALLLGNWG